MDWHPFIVHYPIAFLTLSPLCDLAALCLRRKEWHHLAYGLIVLGALASCAAVLSGNAAADGHWEGPAAAEVSVVVPPVAVGRFCWRWALCWAACRCI